MPKLTRFLVENGIYHAISVTRGRAPILADPRVAQLVVDSINQARARGTLLILAYALLPDHLHLLCVPLNGLTVSDVMKAVKGVSGKAVNKAGLHTGPLWKQSFYDRAIRTEEHLKVAVEYIHRNPVLSGIVQDAKDYRFCSAHPDALTDIGVFFGE